MLMKSFLKVLKAILGWDEASWGESLAAHSYLSVEITSLESASFLLAVFLAMSVT